MFALILSNKYNAKYASKNLTKARFYFKNPYIVRVTSRRALQVLPSHVIGKLTIKG